MVDFDQALRAAMSERLAAHPRRELPLEGRRHAAVAVVVLDSEAERGGPLEGGMAGVAGGASFVLCLRPSNMRNHPGQWALPGGRLGEGESPLDAALREVEEEVGLQLGPDSVVGWLDDYATRSGFVITPVVLWCEGDPTLTPDPGEVLAAYRIGLHALLAGEPRFIEIPESEKPVLQVPLGNDLIHAPTGALLLQFREVALRGRIGERVDHVEEPVFAWR